jgi:hypothetical protein
MTTLRYHTADELDAQMHARGLFCYRETFRWGRMPAYRNRAGTCWRFVDRGDLLTPAALLARLLDEWRPAAWDDQVYAAGPMRTELDALAARDTAAPHA